MDTLDLDSKSKLQILLSALEERYKSLHIIRERIQNVCLWTLGILLATGGWLVQNGTSLTYQQKIFFSILIGIAFIVIRFFYLSDLEKGFKSQQRVAASIEEKLGLFGERFLGASEKSIYPQSWKDAGADTGGGKFVNRNYLLLYIGVTLLLLIIWLY